VGGGPVRTAPRRADAGRAHAVKLESGGGLGPLPRGPTGRYLPHLYLGLRLPHGPAPSTEAHEVPFVVRGPRVPRDESFDDLAANTDCAPNRTGLGRALPARLGGRPWLRPVPRRQGLRGLAMLAPRRGRRPREAEEARLLRRAPGRPARRPKTREKLRFFRPLRHKAFSSAAKSRPTSSSVL
jgi:hypothetical protein